MAGKVERVLEIENAKILWPNFSGKITRFNQNGFRTFNVLIPSDIAKELEKDGWNIKWLKPLEEGDIPQAHLEVKVQYGRTAPKVIMVSGNNKTPLTEDTIGTLDYADIDYVDVIIRPYNWEVNGTTGVKAYLKTLYVVLVEDRFEHKYASSETSL